jgi:hypothetical protein
LGVKDKGDIKMENKEFRNLLDNEEFKKDMQELCKLFSDGVKAVAKKHKAEFGRVLAYTLDILNTGLAITMLESIMDEEHEK